MGWVFRGIELDPGIEREQPCTAPTTPKCTWGSPSSLTLRVPGGLQRHLSTEVPLEGPRAIFPHRPGDTSKSIAGEGHFSTGSSAPDVPSLSHLQYPFLYRDAAAPTVPIPSPAPGSAVFGGHSGAPAAGGLDPNGDPGRGTGRGAGSWVSLGCENRCE